MLRQWQVARVTLRMRRATPRELSHPSARREAHVSVWVGPRVASRQRIARLWAEAARAGSPSSCGRNERRVTLRAGHAHVAATMGGGAALPHLAHHPQVRQRTAKVGKSRRLGRLSEARGATRRLSLERLRAPRGRTRGVMRPAERARPGTRLDESEGLEVAALRRSELAAIEVERRPHVETSDRDIGRPSGGHRAPVLDQSGEDGVEAATAKLRRYWARPPVTARTHRWMARLASASRIEHSASA